MIKPRIPHDETTRLQTLRRLKILDTPPEEPFDRVTRLAKRLFGVETVLVSLVDENRQWFKSRQGLDACETSRGISFCGHAILDHEILVVEDALLDERFFDNPLVTDDPKIRFYAGCPLVVANGSAIGTLCLIDPAPRQMDQDELYLLRDLATMVQENLAALDMATTDELTGISNRRGFHMLAEKSLATCQRLNRKVSVLVFDLDDFKLINDRLGHVEGDNALKDFSSCLLDTFRDCDVIGRTGGDEFCAFLGGADEQVLPDLLDRLSDKLQDRCYQEGRPFEVKFSVGSYSSMPGFKTTLVDLLSQADGRMYGKKHESKAESRASAPFAGSPDAVAASMAEDIWSI
ncbi:MAG: sensor domain-containing diguanylate cyclase [Xanthomonadales bacterium]|nr:sensor domain-containing diguanylate cyclase [Xanthomonadales bacterium]